MSPVQRAIESAWRVEAPRLIGGLVRLTRDVGRAEDLAHEALVIALERWPETGIPHNPGAWLMTAARNRGLDALRHDARVAEKHAEIQAVARFSTEPDEAIEVGDDRLRLILIACHPILSVDARVALTLRLLGGLTTDELARAFLVAESTMAQRIVRAKRTLTEARVPFEVPTGTALHDRMPAVLEVIYLIFNEGYWATSGADVVRPALCADALRLGRTLAALVPLAAEVHGLLALMEIQASRMRTRVAADGSPVLLQDQNRARWDHLAIRRGLDALARAEKRAQPLGPYTLQAAIAACHARARSTEATDWWRIVALYDALVEVTGSPVVALNRAVAVSMAAGPEAGLELVDALANGPALQSYPLLITVRGELLARLGRIPEARAELRRAAAATTHLRERERLYARMHALDPSAVDPDPMPGGDFSA